MRIISQVWRGAALFPLRGSISSFRVSPEMASSRTISNRYLRPACNHQLNYSSARRELLPSPNTSWSRKCHFFVACRLMRLSKALPPPDALANDNSDTAPHHASGVWPLGRLERLIERPQKPQRELCLDSCFSFLCDRGGDCPIRRSRSGFFAAVSSPDRAEFCLLPFSLSVEASSSWACASS